MRANLAASLVVLGLASTPSMASKCRLDKHSSSVSSSSVPSALSVSSVSSVSSPLPSPTPAGNPCTSPQLVISPDFADALFVSSTGWQRTGTDVDRLADCGNGHSCAEFFLDIISGSNELFQSIEGTVADAQYTLKFAYRTVGGMAYSTGVYEYDGHWMHGITITDLLGAATIGPDGIGIGEGVFFSRPRSRRAARQRP